MNNEEFLKRLSEVAEWHRPRLGPNGCESTNKRSKKWREPEHPGVITEEELAAMTDEEAELYYQRLMAWREAQPNESVPPEIKSLKFHPKPCDDCGRELQESHRVEKSIYMTGQRHWRERCTNCNLFRNPMTGEFAITTQQAGNFFSTYYRPKLGAYKSKYQAEPTVKRASRAPEQVREQIMEILHEDQNTLIRSHK